MSEASLQKLLLDWYDRERRDLPWRTEPPDPYRVWVSEVMLQQTTVAMATAKFLQWMERFPTVEALAEASEEEVLAVWQGLGYYSRARRLLQAAKIAAQEGLPTTLEGWLKLPGIGRYSAGAIASIGQNIPAPLADGNVVRVYARLAGDASPYVETERNAWKWAERNLHQVRPGDWNQALMELGATICTPRKPSCLVCPLREVCASAGKKPETLPTPKEKPPKKEIYEDILIPFCEGMVGMIQIPQGEWWEGLWSFPRRRGRYHFFYAGADPEKHLEKLATIKHVVTHHKVTLSVYAFTVERQDPSVEWMTLEEAKAKPMPAPHRKAFEQAVNKIRP